eukprot:2065551-Prymnesium_polylepis.1
MIGPLAPSLVDQVVNHVIVWMCGRTRHVPPGEAERRPGSHDARGRSLAGRREAACAGTLGCQRSQPCLCALPVLVVTWATCIHRVGKRAPRVQIPSGLFRTVLPWD